MTKAEKIQSLTDEELINLTSEDYRKGYNQALEDINKPMEVIQEPWTHSECPKCHKQYHDYEGNNDGYIKRAYSLERCPYCGQKIEWE